jgi:chorismate synthase
VIACEATGVPPGWGAPLYAKLDSELAAACMSINAVKGVEIGDGFAAATLTGEQNADAMRPGSDGVHFLANHAGGIAGGISTGQPVLVRVAFKPTSSILTPVETITREGEATEIRTKGRHDPCVGIRGAPVVEAMVALVLADQKLLHRTAAQVRLIPHWSQLAVDRFSLQRRSVLAARNHADGAAVHFLPFRSKCRSIKHA